jgi:hypothetical protein
LIAVLCAGACARGAGVRVPGSGSAPTTLEVVNRAFFDMTVYVVPETGLRERLGTVTALATSWFRIPQRLVGVGNLRFEGDAFGSNRQHISQMISVVPGDTVMIVIPPN